MSRQNLEGHCPLQISDNMVRLSSSIDAHDRVISRYAPVDMSDECRGLRFNLLGSNGTSMIALISCLVLVLVYILYIPAAKLRIKSEKADA